MKKIIIYILFLLISLTGINAIAPTITLNTLPPPENLTTVMNGTASLPVGVYYYKVVAVWTSGTTSINSISNYNQYRSKPSQEVMVNVTSANSGVTIRWDNVATAGAYLVWRTKVSGSYCNEYNKDTGGCYDGLSLRTSFNVFSTITNSLYDDGSFNGRAEVTDGNQGIYGLLMLEQGLPQVLISNGDITTPFSMELLHNTSVTNGWNITSKSGTTHSGYNYILNATIVDTSVGVYWEEKKLEQNWYIRGGLAILDIDSELQWGVKTPHGSYLASPQINFEGHVGYYSYLPNFFSNGNTTWYGVFLGIRNIFYTGYDEDDSFGAYKYQAGVISNRFEDYYYIEGSHIKGGFYQTSFKGHVNYASKVINNIIEDGSRTFSMSTNAQYITFEDNIIRDNGQALNIERKVATLRGGSLNTNNAGYDAFIYGQAKATLIDVEFNLSRMYIGAQSTVNIAEVWLRHQLNLQIVDVDDVAINNAQVLIYDNNDTLVFNLTTDNNGDITPPDILTEYITRYNLPNNYIDLDVDVDYRNPHRFEISAIGYQDYTKPFTISEKTTSVIKLNKVIPQVITSCPYPSINNNPKNSQNIFFLG